MTHSVKSLLGKSMGAKELASSGLGVTMQYPEQTWDAHLPEYYRGAPALDTAALAQASGEWVDAGTIAATGKIATALNAGSLPDVHLIGRALFTDYNLPLQIIGVLLLVATVGAVTLSKKTQE